MIRYILSILIVAGMIYTLYAYNNYQEEQINKLITIQEQI